MRAAITADGYLRLTAENAKETVDLKRIAMAGHLHLVVKGSRQTRKEHTQVDLQVSLIDWRRPKKEFGWRDAGQEGRRAVAAAMRGLARKRT